MDNIYILSKEDAIKALNNGKKITHRYFHPEEYIEKHPTNNQYYVDECNIPHHIETFWKLRPGEAWLNGWRIF